MSITYRVIASANENIKNKEKIMTGHVELVQQSEPLETDEQIIERMRTRFAMLDDMTKAVKMGHIRSLIVSGPPGVGKSYGVERILELDNLMAQLSDKPPARKFEIIKGSMTALGLYAKLYAYSSPNSILVFDDCDSLFWDDISLNLLKAALDSAKTRRLSWLADSNMLKREDIPNTFDFHGSVIFITNINFDKTRSEKLRPHLEALESRSLYLDLTVNSVRDKMLRIKQIVHDGMLREYKLTQDVHDAIINYIDGNKEKLSELSLRTVLKVADLAKGFPTRWEELADVTVLRRSFH